MKTEWQESFQFYCEERNKEYMAEPLNMRVESLVERTKRKEKERWQRISEEFKSRNMEIKNSTSKIKIIKVIEERPFVKVFYKTSISWELQQGTYEYEQSWLEGRMCLLKEEQGWWILEDELVETEGFGLLNLPLPLDVEYDFRNPNERRATYNRAKAVEYAQRWWNDYNPEFRQFDVDCTNYVSQCLYAGGAPMKHSADRAKGWWYRNEGRSFHLGGKQRLSFLDDEMTLEREREIRDTAEWSFSWAVAHSLRWYLPTSDSGLRGREVTSAEQLEPGDVICYDFNGDGRWQHTTIVVAKDGAGMPLVNAHTSNSKNRYWAYRDSYAWTEKTAYKFFHIIDRF